ncbi:translocating chain-associated membrane protein 1 [Clonorchis sinensis]|uniref:Translocating chain-associated membrane protein 1 n=1 Tax=Clonorchis sinensis TaxID=79923 RepID=G7YHS9_CLOSI|nr:translocating chain-associated membrane protein 1 [Clonorchis sinensis]
MVCQTTNRDHALQRVIKYHRSRGRGSTRMTSECTDKKWAMKYLGFTTDEYGHPLDPDNINAIKCMQAPTHVASSGSVFKLIDQYSLFLSAVLCLTTAIGDIPGADSFFSGKNRRKERAKSRRAAVSRRCINDHEGQWIRISGFRISTLVRGEQPKTALRYKYRLTTTDVDEMDVHRMRMFINSTNFFSTLRPDEVQPMILKEASLTLVEHFYLMYRQSLDDGDPFSAWKEAIVKPVYKNGDRLSSGKRRPISLTGIPCKMMGRILLLSTNNLISPAQQGFLPNSSCAPNMLLFMDSLTQAKDEGLIPGAIFFGFSGAFDRVRCVAPQLATLIAGDSDDHTGAKERRLRPNKPYTTRQIRKLLAGFKVQSSEKTSLMGAPPKELPGAATQRSKHHRDTFPTKPRQNAQKAKQTQDRPLSNSKPGRPKDVIERATSSNGRNFCPRGKKLRPPKLIGPRKPGSHRAKKNVQMKSNPRNHQSREQTSMPQRSLRSPRLKPDVRNFCRADFSGMRIFLNQVKLGPASVEDLYRTIVQKVHEADAMYVPKKPARSRTSRKLPKRIRRLLEKRSQLFLKKLTTGDTEDELAFRKMRNRCKSEIRQWNIRKQATILDLARKNRNVLFKYMRHRRRNKPSAFSLRDRNGEPTSDPIVVSEFYRDHYAGDSANSFVMHGEKGPEDITRIDAKKDLGIWLSPNLSFSLHLEKSAQKAFAVLRMIRRTFSRITRTDFQILYGAYVRPLFEYANPVVYSGRTKDVILIERVQRAATKMVAGLKSMDYETRLVVLDLFPLEYRRLRGDLILTYALFEQGLANRFFTVDPANTRRGHGERQLLNDKNKTDPGNLGESLAPVYQSVNPRGPNTYVPFGQILATILFTVKPSNARQKHGYAISNLKVHTFIRRQFFSFRLVGVRYSPSKTQFKELPDGFYEPIHSFFGMMDFRLRMLRDDVTEPVWLVNERFVLLDGEHKEQCYTLFSLVPFSMTLRTARKKSKNPPYFSHEFVITNHGDIVSFVAMIIVIGLLYKGTHSLSSNFVFIQHNVTDEERPGAAPLYSPGRYDMCLVFFYSLICIVTHAVLQEYVFDRFEKKLNLTKIRLGKFNESAHLTCFYTLSVIWGIYNVVNENLIPSLSSLWEGYPHSLLPFWTKMFLLIQICYWIHDFPELYFQRVKKVMTNLLGVLRVLGTHSSPYSTCNNVYNWYWLRIRRRAFLLPINNTFVNYHHALIRSHFWTEPDNGLATEALADPEGRRIYKASPCSRAGQTIGFIGILKENPTVRCFGAYMVWNFITFHQRSRRDKQSHSSSKGGWLGGASQDAGGAKKKEKKKVRREEEELSDGVAVDSAVDQRDAWQPGSISALVHPSGGTAARHRKGFTAERFIRFQDSECGSRRGGMAVRHRKNATTERLFFRSVVAYCDCLINWPIHIPTFLSHCTGQLAKIRRKYQPTHSVEEHQKQEIQWSPQYNQTDKQLRVVGEFRTTWVQVEHKLDGNSGNAST